MYDLVIIGSGPAGIAAARQANHYRLKTAIIDYTSGNFGGTCLNKGCIPAKYYLEQSKYKSDLKLIHQGKQDLIAQIKSSAISYLQRKGIDFLWGRAKFIDSNHLAVNSEEIEAKNIIVATGSIPQSIYSLDNQPAVFADDIFSHEELPDNILIVGAGYIGLETACFLHNLGKKVLVIEKEERILPSLDQYLSRRLQTILEKKGVAIRLSQDFIQYDRKQFDMIIYALGRRPNLADLDHKAAGLRQDDQGWLTVDERLHTSAENIFACGDITGQKLLAYVADKQGSIAVENIVGNDCLGDYYGLPECVFTQPQAAFVGILEEEAKKKNIAYKIIKSNFLRFSSAFLYSDTDGFIQVLFDKDDTIIGASVISQLAAELIGLFSFAIRQKTTISQLKKMLFIHPTLSEIISGLFDS
ncbi:MAG: NAD(P)/FAD-dependent oxidoreductase [Candidatus Omnitrophota bacterium]